MSQRTTEGFNRKTARQLVVAYQGYCEAIANEDVLGVCVWGDMLMAAQVVTGIDMRDPAFLQNIINIHRRAANSVEAA